MSVDSDIIPALPSLDLSQCQTPTHKDDSLAVTVKDQGVAIPALPTYPPPNPVSFLSPPTIIIPASNESFASLFTRASDASGPGEITQTKFDPLATIRPKSSAVDTRSCSTESVAGTFDQVPYTGAAAGRFSRFPEEYRLIPPNYATLPASCRSIPPPPLTSRQKTRSIETPPISIPRSSIVTSYYPPQYFGTRRAYTVNPSVVARRHVRRGIQVIFEGVVGVDVNYHVNRVRKFHGDVADVELVAFTNDGQSHPETSATWPPIVVELPATAVLMTERQIVTEPTSTEFQQEEEELFGAFLPCESTLFSMFFHCRNPCN